MNNNIKLFTMLAALIMFTGVSLSAHKPGEVNKAIDELVNKYDGKISDFIIVIEEDKSKTIMYMDGDLVVK